MASETVACWVGHNLLATHKAGLATSVHKDCSRGYVFRFLPRSIQRPDVHHTYVWLRGPIVIGGLLLSRSRPLLPIFLERRS